MTKLKTENEELPLIFQANRKYHTGPAKHCHSESLPAAWCPRHFVQQGVVYPIK